MDGNISDSDVELVSTSFLNSTDVLNNTGGIDTDGGGFSTESLVWMVLDGMIGSLGICGNGLVIFVFIRTISLRNLVNLFIINQSLIDFTTSLVFLLLHLGPDIVLTPGNRLDLFVCRFWKSEYVMWALFISSSINLVNITLERYFAIMWPQQYRQSSGTIRRRIVPFAVLTWSLGFIIDSYWAVIQEIVPDWGCIPVWKSKALQGFVGVLIFFVTYLGPLSVMFFTYFQIIRQLRRASKRTASTKSPLRTVSNVANGGSQNSRLNKSKSLARSNAKKNVIKTMLSVSTVYGICWAPIAFNYLVYNLGGPLDFTGTWYAVTKVFAYANMCANPFIYTMQYRQFQLGLKRTFGISSETDSIDMDGTSQQRSHVPRDEQ